MGLLVYGFASAQSFKGSWKLIHLNNEDVSDREVIKIVTDSYFALGSKDNVDNSFLGAAGGNYKIEDNTLIEKRDFDTYDSSKINKVKKYQLMWLTDDKVQLSDAEHNKVWERLSSDEDDLSGNWVIIGRMRDGQMNTMTPGDRRTLKILNGHHFQWIAFNVATKRFMASGGGTYKAENGVYIEHITFFSKDKDRVGDDLDFAFEIIDGKWHHKGKSSKGNPIYEIWSPYSDVFSTYLKTEN